jgi:hypothetical protein
MEVVIPEQLEELILLFMVMNIQCPADYALSMDAHRIEGG